MKETLLYFSHQERVARYLSVVRSKLLSSLSSTLSSTTMVSSTLSTTSSITSSLVTSSAVTSSAVMGMFTTVGVPEIGVVTIASLVVLLGIFEVLSGSDLWNKRLAALLNLAISPMLLTFLLIVLFKVRESL
ncbi:MAG: hypothetical protein MUO26_01805 [Methanotrichaceae archaeon]|nr:hypothetical protein [Methanotrichaceae archaeon]